MQCVEIWYRIDQYADTDYATRLGFGTIDGFGKQKSCFYFPIVPFFGILSIHKIRFLLPPFIVIIQIFVVAGIIMNIRFATLVTSSNL